MRGWCKQKAERPGRPKKKVTALFFPAVPGTALGATGILSDRSFSSLSGHVGENTLRAIADMGFTHMTDIQVRREKKEAPPGLPSPQDEKMP